MNWEAIAAIGELVSAIAVVFTLIFLAVQLRHGARSIEESNRLERVSAIDRHNDTIRRWRGRLMENKDLARVWLVATRDEELDEIEEVQVAHLFVDFTNTQRANYKRAKTVGEEGMALLAITSVAVEVQGSKRLIESWKSMRPFLELVEPDFWSLVDARITELQQDKSQQFQVRPPRYVPVKVPTNNSEVKCRKTSLISEIKTIYCRSVYRAANLPLQTKRSISIWFKTTTE